jgi:hypothetical protein
MMSRAFYGTLLFSEDRLMPSRPRSSTSKSSNDSAKRATAARAATQTDSAAENSDTAQAASDSTPEVRLLGSLQPVPSREERIAISAYWRAAQRQFAPGHELDDWLEAERELDSQDTAPPSESR